MFHVNLDLGDLLDLADLKDIVKKTGTDVAKQMATAIHGHAIELANERLKTRRKIFVDALKVFPATDGDDSTWIVSLDAKVRWVDDGQSEHNMLDDLLSSKKAKTAKDGHKYVIVPFDHSPGKGTTGATPAQQDLISTIKKELKKQKIPFGKIERDPSGNPKLGLLHRLNIMNQPTKDAEGPGMGKGPVGSVRQGPTGVPFLQGINVYQSEHTDGNGETRVKRSVMTFRVASDKHRNQGDRWDHPGTKPVSIMEDSLKWAEEQWSSQIAPALKEALIAKLG